MSKIPPCLYRRYQQPLWYSPNPPPHTPGPHSLTPTGNKPPWVLPAKSKYFVYDTRRSASRLSLPYEGSPGDLFTLAKTLSPLRALTYIKEKYPSSVFLATTRFFFHRLWLPPHVPLSEDENLAAVLSEATDELDGGSGKKLFTDEDVRAIMEGREGMKEKVKKETSDAVGKGAFGAPWLWVTNDEGKSEPFFGSDR